MANYVVIAMELADGSLSDWQKECKDAGQRGIPVAPLLEYFHQAAVALDFLHAQKPAVMHRDIKPANLLRLEGFAKVADFGLVREQDHNLATATYCGTPAYMPPEMWNSKVHINSDQYSLAVTFVEMRLGRRCFSANNPRELAFQHLEGRANLEGLGPAEQAVLFKALSPDPVKRYPSCQAFIKALKDVHQPEQKKNGPGSRLLLGLLATGLTLVLAALSVLSYLHFRTKADWDPPGWEVPKDRALTLPDIENRRYWKSLTKNIHGQKVTLLAIPRTNSNDPDTFYIMRDKVWNDLFRAVMETPEAKEKLEQRLTESGLQTRDLGPKNQDYIELGKWRLGAMVGKDYLGVEGEKKGTLPVMNVTVLEAHVFAEMLGGRLPSLDQYFKAAGKGEVGERKRRGPFVEDPSDPNNIKGIALGLAAEGPRPVGTSERDVSVFGCRDQAGNGMEWTRTLFERKGQEVPVSNIRMNMPSVYIVGRNYIDIDPMLFDDPVVSVLYNKTEPYYGFRIVLEEKNTRDR